MKVLYAYPAHKCTDYKVLSYYGHFVSSKSLIDEIKTHNLDITTIGPKEVSDITYDITEGSSRYQKKIFEQIESINENYDIVHYHVGAWNSINYFNKIKKPLVLTIHNSPALSMGLAFYSRNEMLKVIDNQDVTIVFPTEHARVSFLESIKYPSVEPKTKTILHGINIYGIGIFPTESIEEDRHLRNYLSVGRLDDIKNFHLASELLGVELDVIGGLNSDSKYPLEYWTDIFTKNGTGYSQPIDKQSLYSHYIDYTSYLSLCRIESFGFTAVEAASVGTPIIVPNAGGLGEIATILGIPTIDVPFRKKKGLKSRIQELHEINKLYTIRDRLTLSGKVRQYFSIEIEAKKYIDLYKEIHGRN